MYRLHKDFSDIILISDSEDDGDLSRLDVVEDNGCDDSMRANEDDSYVSTKDLEEQDIVYE